MTEFVLLLALIALTLGVILFWPRSLRSTATHGRQAQEAEAIYAQQCRQAESALADPALAQALQRELEKDILPAPAAVEVQAGRPSGRMALLLWVSVVLLSGGAYVLSGDYHRVRAGIAAIQNDPFSELTPLQKEDRRLEKLKTSLRATPEDSVLWAELGEQYLLLNAYDHATKAYERALALRGENAELLSALATVLYYRDGQHLSADARALIDRALAQDPGEVSALMLLASDAFFAADYARAIDIWQTLLDGGSPRINRVKLIEAIQTARMMQQNAMP